jgi:hypothetical protein
MYVCIETIWEGEKVVVGEKKPKVHTFWVWGGEKRWERDKGQ